MAGKECEGARKMEGAGEELKEPIMFIAVLHFPLFSLKVSLISKKKKKVKVK